MTSNTSLSNESEADIPHFQALLIQEGASELADLIDQRKEVSNDLVYDLASFLPGQHRAGKMTVSINISPIACPR